MYYRILDPDVKRRIAIGFAVAAILLSVLITVVGRGDVFQLLNTAQPGIVALGLLSGVLALTFRSFVWMRFLPLVGTAVTRRHVGSMFLVAMFIKYITPYGQIATEPFVAYLVSRNAEMEYEDGLAGILSADLLNYVPYYSFGFLAIIAIAIGGTVAPAIHTYLLAFGLLFVLITVLVYTVIRRRSLIDLVVISIGSFARKIIGRLTDRDLTALRETNLKHRIDGFYVSVETITSDTRSLLIAGTYAHLGMLFLMAPVYLGAQAIGFEVSFAVVALTVSLGKLGSIVPAPGGLGGVEAAVTIGLITLAGLDDASALTIALIYRLCTYWLTIALGGTFTVALLVRR